MVTEDRNRAALSAGQARYDNAAPDDPDEGCPWRCVQCGHHFDVSEIEEGEDGGVCPACGDNDICECEPEPYSPEEL